jgi:hypothetical protein
MESKRFDELSKAIATMASRRKVLRGIVAGVAAATAGVVSRGVAEAGSRGPGQICRKTGDCLAGLTCDPVGYGRSRCSCPEGQSGCGSTCCTTFCSPDQVCYDDQIDPVCYADCVNEYCYGTNSSSFFINGQYTCEEFCAFFICSNLN